MFARSSQIHAQAPMIDAGIAHVRNVVMPAMSHIDGFVGLSLMVDHESGRCIATSAWRSEQAMRDSSDRAGDLRNGAADAFGGTAEMDEWEVALMHRAHHAHPGTCMRATWSQTDPANLDKLLELFKFGTLPRIEDLPGFRSASLLVNRTDGRCVVTVAYASRETLDQGRDAGSALREETSREGNVDVLDVAEFDLAIAHLHVPEMV